MTISSLKTVRYIKTKVDDRNCILHQVNCNHCPFMVFDRIYVTVRCRKFRDLAKYDDFITKVNGYSIVGSNAQPLNTINIPNWCQLAGTIESVQNDSWVYTKSNSLDYNTEFNNNSLNVISSNVVIWDANGDALKIIDKLKSNYASNVGTKSTRNTKLSEFTKTNFEYIRLDTCSCCGEKKEKVDRDKKSGMCSGCWDKYKDDKHLRNFSFINNFRLKRNKDWIDEKFKKIEKNSVI